METLLQILGECCCLRTAVLKAVVLKVACLFVYFRGEQKKAYPDRVAYEEEEAVKDPVLRKLIKEAGAEVERTEGRGILKVGGDLG